LTDSVHPLLISITMQKDSKADHVEDATAENSHREGTVDPQEVHRVLRKVDWRLIPVLTFLYIMCYMDRSNSKLELQASTNVLYLTFLQSETPKSPE